ncbi:[Fe-Fe] hydrogenase large subunit C-terminal domain-containing protein [Dendrosporobacter sp. 1207_IL3150]|uniref:[Fe-Fe] hydrogenase large subunit C-terminal domain-containing protein n=1 Tax=Dendrosporobacter sp. 1207_IL3150 TaxID=3084054 RepID=UPI002FDB8144
MQIITTRKVNCKDCHRCLRVCPVKAIGINQGRARVLDDKCILCGQCVTECPQHAKHLISHVPTIQEAIQNGRKVILSLGSSFLGLFPEYTPAQLVSAIKALGFSAVEETAVGAEAVSLLYRKLVKTSTKKTLISSNCPVIVNIVKKYYPNLVENLAPIVSPMMAHGQIMKRNFGEDAYVVFAGPCMAKFAEHNDLHAVDSVMTFVQLRQWLNRHKYENGNSPVESYEPEPLGNARFFPLAGGILKSFMDFDILDTEIIAVDGIEDCKEVFESLSRGEIAPRFIEAFSCNGGCIGGPAGGSTQPMPVRRLKAIEYANSVDKKVLWQLPEGVDFSITHLPDPVKNVEPTEDEIKEILHQIGKFTRVDEKNCGACGYNTCRDKAVAVYSGLAETEMCMPYMRSKAESFANIIVENSLNGIIAVNEKMIIQELNPAAKQMFSNKKPMEKGNSLTEFIDCSDFVAAANYGHKVLSKRVEYSDHGVITEQMIVPVPQHGLVIGVITNVTDHEKRTQEWQKMKEETVAKASEIINKQMQVAQEIAGLLGETTAETKSALLEMVWVLKGKEEK